MVRPGVPWHTRQASTGDGTGVLVGVTLACDIGVGVLEGSATCSVDGGVDGVGVTVGVEGALALWQRRHV